jgi:hypothetical protein
MIYLLQILRDLSGVFLEIALVLLVAKGSLTLLSLFHSTSVWEVCNAPLCG